MKISLGFLVVFLLISCNNTFDSDIVGLWTVDGRKIVQVDTSWTEQLASNHKIQFEFKTDGTFKSNDNLEQ